MSAPNRKSLPARPLPLLRLAAGTVATIALGAAPVRAQAHAEGPLVLRLPVSARALALSNAGIASTDADVLLINPGMLSRAAGAAASLQRYGSSGTAGALASVTTVGSVTVGVGAQLLDYAAPSLRYDDVVRAGSTPLSDGGPVTASSSAFTLALARQLFGWRVGGSIKYAEDRLGPVQDGTVAADLGVMRPVGRALLGVVAQNLGVGPRLGGVRGSLPTRIGVGFGSNAMPITAQLDLGAQVALTVERDGFVRPAGGIEIGYVPIDGVQLALRNGYRLPREPDEPLVTAGFGVTIDRFALDYALEPMRGGRPVSHRIGVRIR